MKITFTELMQILRNDRKRRQLKRRIAALEAERDALLVESAAMRQRILELLAGDAELQAKATAAFEKSEAVEAKMRAGLPVQP